MLLTFSLFLSIIFYILSLLHFNWAFGGKWSFDKVIPVNADGEKVFNPKKRHSLIVGLCLLIFAFHYLLQSGLLSSVISGSTPFFEGWIISILFILRAIGDFNYIGFFKKVKHTDYANLDTKFYTPLCLIMGLMGIIIELISK